MARIYTAPYEIITDANGDPVSGAKRYFYEPGSTTDKTVYSDSDLTTAHSQPVVADSRGALPTIFLKDTEAYKSVLTDANDVVISTDDPVSGTPFSADTRIEFDTVALLQADLTIGYSGTALTVSTGDYVYAGFYKYTVADSAATDHHITNSNSVKFYAQPNDDGFISTEQVGFKGTGLSGDSATDVAALDRLFPNSDKILLSPGIYPIYTIDDNDKIVKTTKAAVFKLPDNTVTGTPSSNTAALTISGNNIVVQGVLYVDGNNSNNTAVSNTGDITGALTVTGDNPKFQDILIENANWVSLGVGTSSVTVDHFDANSIKTVNGRHYSTQLWNMDQFAIGKIIVESGAQSSDGRVRTGSGTLNSFGCFNGTIGSINCEQSVVFESNTEQVIVGEIVTQLGCKVEDSSGVQIGSVTVNGSTGDGYSFALNASSAEGLTDVSVGQIFIKDHDGDTSAATFFSNVKNCQIGSVNVIGTVNNASDLVIRSADGLQIDNISLTAPAGTGKGLLFDYDASYDPQRGIQFGNVISRGHTGNDVEIQEFTTVDYRINSINSDATCSPIPQ